jgi:hypothetical protein
MLVGCSNMTPRGRNRSASNSRGVECELGVAHARETQARCHAVRGSRKIGNMMNTKLLHGWAGRVIRKEEEEEERECGGDIGTTCLCDSGRLGEDGACDTRHSWGHGNPATRTVIAWVGRMEGNGGVGA